MVGDGWKSERDMVGDGGGWWWVVRSGGGGGGGGGASLLIRYHKWVVREGFMQ